MQQQQQTPMQQQHAQPNNNPFASAPASSSGSSSQQQAVLSLPPVASKSYADDVANQHHKRLPHQPPPTTTSTAELTPAERAKQNRDRNREHARSTRLRKKAYVQKLKELVEGLHAERAEQVRARRVAVQHLAEKQQVRRGVVRSFLQFHCEFETEEKKWKTILEEDFWLKQPVTPYRSFRRAEIEKVRCLLLLFSSCVYCRSTLYWMYLTLNPLDLFLSLSSSLIIRRNLASREALPA